MTSSPGFRTDHWVGLGNSDGKNILKFLNSHFTHVTFCLQYRLIYASDEQDMIIIEEPSVSFNIPLGFGWILRGSLTERHLDTHEGHKICDVQTSTFAIAVGLGTFRLMFWYACKLLVTKDFNQFALFFICVALRISDKPAHGFLITVRYLSVNSVNGALQISWTISLTTKCCLLFDLSHREKKQWWVSIDFFTVFIFFGEHTLVT